MRFSERQGYKPPKLMQVDDLDGETRSRIWNVLRPLLQKDSTGFAQESVLISDIQASFFKKPIDELPVFVSEYLEKFKSWFMKSAFFELLDLFEFLSPKYVIISKSVNVIFEDEKVAFRLFNHQIVQISDLVELGAIEAALNSSDSLAGARSHLTAALTAFSKRPTADYPNAVREAISAVESAAKVIASNSSATLGDAIKAIETRSYMNPRFKDAVTKLYAYTNDEKGIRHARIGEEANVDEADAHFMIVTCAAIVNFLVQRYGG